MRYDVTEVKGFNSTRVFNVVEVRAIAGPGRAVNVWLSDRPRCTDCSGPLKAMLSSCPHANAVRRYVAAKAASIPASA